MEGVEVLIPPIKSEGDHKNYRHIKLENGLKALLIQKVEENPETENENRAAANLTVGVGSFDEPSNIGGLAHFLEHMLSMGSKKYPEESGYSKFLALNGGDHNAMTENEYTNYFFEISESALPEALDRFAQQFVAPLLLKDALQREREAVDSEFQMSMSRDDARIIAFYKIFINESHPASFFDYGNLVTLKEEITDDDLYNAVRDIFQKYVANNMFLAIQSKRTLDEMQEMVITNFSHLKSGEVASRLKQSVDEIFDSKFYNKIYYVKVNSESKKLILSWYIESVDEHYKCLPLTYLHAIFDNQGEGGITHYLKERQLATNLRFQIDYQSFDANSMFALIKIVVELTDFGTENIDSILEAFFSYLLMIKETSADEHRRVYDELKEKSEIDFRFHVESEATGNVTQGSLGMKYFDAVDIIRGHRLFQKFDEKIIFDVINAMNERKFNMIFLDDQHNQYDKKQKYFKTEYEELDFPEAYQRLWDARKVNPEFFLQKPNPFRTTDFKIFVNEEESPEYPSKIIDHKIIEVWHKLDNKFKIPKAVINVNILSPKQMTSSYNSLLLMLYKKLFDFTIPKKEYPAVSAGLSSYLRASRNGLEIKFRGYNEKVHLLVDMITNALKNTVDEIEETVFDLVKTQLKKKFIAEFKNVEVLASQMYDKIIMHDHYTNYDHYQQIDRATFESLQRFVHKFFEKIQVQVLVQGNLTKTQAQEIVGNLETNLNGEPNDERYQLKIRAYQLPLGTHTLRMKSLMTQDDNSVVKVFYQVGSESIRNSCLLRLLESILNPESFAFLRTKEQLGYSVGVSMEETGNIIGLSVYVSSQEGKHSYSTVLEKIETFMNDIAKPLIENLPDDDFENFKDSIIQMLATDDLHLTLEAGRNWMEITSFNFLFDRLELSLKMTKTLTKTDLQEFFKSFTQPENIRRLIIQVVGNLQNASQSVPQESSRDLKVEFLTEKLNDDENLITDIADFQSKLFLYPAVSHHEK